MEKTRTICSRAPLRLGLAGGGSDVDPFCSNFGGRVLNATISHYVYSTISQNDGPSVLRSSDQGLEVVDIETEHAPQYPGKLPLHRATYDFFRDRYPQLDLAGLTLSTFTDAPIGSGLGTSSTLVVCLIKGISAFFKLEMSNYEIAAAAHTIERDMCGFRGGRQDSFAATFGGVNYMSFEGDRATITPIQVPTSHLRQFESQLVMFHLGTSRVSSQIIEEQSKSVNSGASSNFDAMMKIRSEAKVMRELILKGDFGGVAKSLQTGWENKKATSSKVSTPQIDNTYEIAMKSGAVAGKVSGAGGGGYMLFMVPLHNRFNLTQELEKLGGGAVLSVNFTMEGAKAWQVI